MHPTCSDQLSLLQSIHRRAGFKVTIEHLSGSRINRSRQMDFGEPDPEAWQVQQMHPHSPLPYAGTKSLLTLPQRGLCSECMHPTSSSVSLRAVAVPIFLNRGRRQISGTAVGGLSPGLGNSPHEQGVAGNGSHLGAHVLQPLWD